MQRDVFISYSRRNLDAVKAIKQQIDVATGTECWIDLEGIETGNPRFDKEIVEGINNCKVFLFMLSDESQQSEYALLELNYAKLNNKHVVIVNIDDCSMKGSFLFKYSLTDTIAWHNQPQREKLLRDLRRWLGVATTQPATTTILQPPPPPTHAPEPHTTTLQPATPPVVTPSPDPLQELEKRLARLDREVGDLHKFKKVIGGKYGFQDINNRVIIPAKWNYADDFREGFARVKDSNGKYGFIDKTGQVVISCQWEAVESFHEGLAGVIDSFGKWGFIDKTGQVVIPCQWDFAFHFSEGLAGVEDSSGKLGYIDKTGRVVIPCRWIDVGWFHEGFACMKDANGKYGYIDKTGSVVIPCQWENAYSFNEGLASVKDSFGKWGYIDKTGRVVIPCKWISGGRFRNGFAIVSNGEKRYKIFKSGIVFEEK